MKGILLILAFIAASIVAYGDENPFSGFRLLDSMPADYEEVREMPCEEVPWEFANRYLIQRTDRYFNDEHFRCHIIGRVNVGGCEYLIYKIVSKYGYNLYEGKKMVDVFICSIDNYRPYPKSLRLYSARLPEEDTTGYRAFQPKTSFLSDGNSVFIDDVGLDTVAPYIHQSTFSLSDSMKKLEGFDDRLMPLDPDFVVCRDDLGNPIRPEVVEYKKFDRFPEDCDYFFGLRCAWPYPEGMPDSFQQVLNEDLVFDPYPYSFCIVGEYDTGDVRIVIGAEGLYDYRRVLVSMAYGYEYPPMLSISYIFNDGIQYRIIDGDRIEMAYSFPDRIIRHTYRLDGTLAPVGKPRVEIIPENNKQNTIQQ